MADIVIFIEAKATQVLTETAICSKACALLNERGFMVGSMPELLEVLEELKSADLSAAIFVINTFGAKELILQLNSFMPEVPALFLRRQLFAGQSGLMDHIRAAESAADIDAITIEQLPTKHRRHSIWYYGTKNLDEVARRAAKSLTLFLDKGDFYAIEKGEELRTRN